MSEKYRVCLIMPKGYAHSLVFTEQVQLLRSTFNSLGLDVTVGINELEPDRTNILLAYHLLRFTPGLARYRYIPYQFEQLGTGGSAFDNPQAREVLRNAAEVWEFSEANLDAYREMGIRAKYLPIGFHPDLETLPEAPEKDIDVIFSGSMNDRRKRVLEVLHRDPGVRLHVMFGAYGEEKNRLLSRAKIHLNIHYGESKMYEQPRIASLINNRCFVVSEDCRDNPYPEVPLCMVPYEKLAETCKHYLQREKEREALREETYRAFQTHYPMVEHLRRVLVSLS